jgi:UDP-glucose 4-epimerase
MVLPRFVEAAVANRPLIVHDDGRQVRCFAHVHDVVATVIALMQQPEAQGRVFNIGSDEPISILDLAKRVIASAKSRSRVEFQSYADAYDSDFEDIRRRVPNLSRLMATVAYRPQYDLDGIIGELVVQAETTRS